ncbi:MAG: GNAT family N-acetyltransferase [Acidobacteriaceae bacterium]
MLLAAATPEAPHWEHPVYEAFLSSRGGPPRQILVGEHAGDLGGFIAGQITMDVCEIESIVVAFRHRRTGAGRALLDALIAWALKSGGSRLQLEVRLGNSSAITFYEQAGFSRDGLRRAYYHNPEEDAVLMSRSIASRIGSRIAPRREP